MNIIYKMNHQKVYDNIIEKARSENRKKLKKINPSYVYYNNHHIYPRCMGGGNEKENMQLVTAKEHYICHKLLTYIYPKHRGIVYAFFRMSTSKKYGHISSSRDYSYTKELLNLIPISEETKRKIGVKSSQRTHSSETRKKISINTIKKLKEPDVKNKMCAASQGRDPWNKNNPGCFSNKSIMKMSNSHIGLVSGMKDKHHKKEKCKNKKI